ncbi:MAG: hypothetical protein WB507_11820 [Solirubrobacterales bacterium]
MQTSIEPNLLNRTPRARLLAPLALISGVLLAGCGAGSGSQGLAASGGATRPTQLAFSKCMRGNGVPNFPDPSSNGLIRVRAGVDPSSPTFTAAQAKCQKFRPNEGGPLSGPPPSAQKFAQMLRVSRCMRRRGIANFPDPRATPPSSPQAALGPGGGVISNIEGVIFVFPHGVDLQSPALARAAALCGFPLHNH